MNLEKSSTGAIAIVIVVVIRIFYYTYRENFSYLATMKHPFGYIF